MENKNCKDAKKGTDLGVISNGLMNYAQTELLKWDKQSEIVQEVSNYLKKDIESYIELDEQEYLKNQESIDR